MPAARLVEHALERGNQRRQVVHELLALHAVGEVVLGAAQQQVTRGGDIAPVRLEHVLHQLRNRPVLPAWQHKAEDGRNHAANHRIDQPLAHHGLAARHQQVDLDQHLYAGGDGRIAVLDGGKRRTGHQRHVQHRQQHQRLRHHAQHHHADQTADQRADQPVVVALLGQAVVRLQDHDNREKNPIAVRRIRQPVAQPEPYRHRHRDAQRVAERRRAPAQVVQDHAQLVLLAGQERGHVRSRHHLGRLHRRAGRLVQLANQRDGAANHLKRLR
ncbi:hypothetical protein D3C85_1114640 [compost metagenome]